MRARHWVILALTIALLLISTYVLNWDLFAGSMSAIRDLAVSHILLTSIIFIAVQVVAEVLLAPGTPFTIMGGLLFGVWLGSAYSLFSSVLSAMIIFWIIRYSNGSRFLSNLNERFKLVKRYNLVLEEDGFKQVLLFRLMPGVPGNIISLSFAVTTVNVRDYFWATVFGNLPITILLSYVGSFLYAREVPNLLYVVVVTMLVSYLFYWKSSYYKRFVKDVK